MTIEKRIWQRKPYRTAKQVEVMGKILKLTNEGAVPTVRSLHAMISFPMVWNTFRKLVENLERSGFVTRERLKGTKAAPGETIVKPTLLGYDWFRPER